MHFLQKNRLIVAAVLVVILGGGIAYLTYNHLHPVPDTTTFKATHFSFEYPRTFAAREYAMDVVSVGKEDGDTLKPNIEVVRYQSDPDVALPASFDAFMKRQAAALCGTDSSVESIACTEVGVTKYTNPKGMDGAMLNLTLVRTNLKTGAKTSSTYGPMYVFNNTPRATADSPLRYSAVFIYPSLSAFLNGTTSPALMQQVVTSFLIPQGAVH